MSQLVMYPEDLQEEIVKYKNYIPRRLRYHERLKQYHRYYNESYGIFKVKEIYTEGNNEYYCITFGSSMTAVIQYPCYNNKRTYELLRNYNGIENASIINNRVQLFTGAEIRFWFLVNNDVDFNNENYIGFFNDLKQDRIYDGRKYRVRRNKKLNIYEFLEQ